MASHKTAHGTVWHDPVRSDHGGEPVRVWLNAPLQATLRQLAAERGCTLAQAARLVLDGWLAEQTREAAA